MQKIYSVDDVFGGKSYFNEDGEKIAWSAESILGGEVIYNRDGERIGYSEKSVFGGKTYYLEDEEEEPGLSEFDRHMLAARQKDLEREQQSAAIRKKFLEDPWDEICNP